MEYYVYIVFPSDVALRPAVSKSRQVSRGGGGGSSLIGSLICSRQIDAQCLVPAAIAGMPGRLYVFGLTLLSL